MNNKASPTSAHPKDQAGRARKTRNIRIALVLLVLLFAFRIRMNAFWLPHWAGDQNHYLGLAMKLDRLGFDHFNLRGIDVRFLSIGPEKKLKLAYVTPAADPEDKGDLLRSLEAIGVTYYDQPFFHKPPGFPLAIMLSHKLLAGPEQPYVVVVTNIGKAVFNIRPPVLYQTQFYAAVIPVFFSLGTVFMTFLLGRTLFSFRTGLYASFMMAIHPVAIMTSQKLLADDMVAFFVVLAVLLLVKGLRSQNEWFFLLAGIMCGTGVLAKQTAGYLLIAFFVYTVLQRKHYLRNISKLPAVIMNRRFVLMAVGVFIVSGFWFAKIYGMFGDPLWLPPKPPGSAESGWFQILRQRPPGWILFPAGIIYLCPVFAGALFTLKRAARQFRLFLSDSDLDLSYVLLWVVILTFYIMRGKGHEHRHMLPVYPFITVLSGHVFDRLRTYRGRFSEKLPAGRMREIIVIVLFIACAAWAVPIGVRTAVENQFLLLKPF